MKPFSKGHVLILGITESGKTTLAFKLARDYKNRGIRVFVLDPDKRKEWNADFITDDAEYFVEACKVNQSCALFIDEGGVTIGRYAGSTQWLATNARKWGHKAHFISQRAQQIDPNVRNNCSSICLFKQSLDDAKILAREFAAPELVNAVSLKTGQYLRKVGVDGEVEYLTAFTIPS